MLGFGTKFGNVECNGVYTHAHAVTYFALVFGGKGMLFCGE